jgi:membrane protease YdiL (CAAX protease family)
MDSRSPPTPSEQPAGHLPEASAHQGHGEPWGYVMSVVWAALAFVICSVAAVAFIAFALKMNVMRAMESPYDGKLLASISIVSSIVQVAVLLVAIRIRNWPIPLYLGLQKPLSEEFIRALLIMALAIGLLEGAVIMFGNNVVPTFQLIAYRTAKEEGWLVPLFVAIVLFAPVSEEIMFRGFLYRGLVRRPGHEPVAIFIITLVWTAAHLQYDLQELTQVFLMGIVLGGVRWWTGSTTLTIAMHVLANFWSMVETVVWIEWYGS